MIHNLNTPKPERDFDPNLKIYAEALQPGTTWSIQLEQLSPLCNTAEFQELPSGVLAMFQPIRASQEGEELIEPGHDFYLVDPRELPTDKLDMQVIPANTDETYPPELLRDKLVKRAEFDVFGIFDNLGTTTFATKDALLDLVVFPALTPASYGWVALRRQRLANGENSPWLRPVFNTEPLTHTADQLVVGQLVWTDTHQFSITFPVLPEDINNLKLRVTTVQNIGTQSSEPVTTNETSDETKTEPVVDDEPLFLPLKGDNRPNLRTAQSITEAFGEPPETNSPPKNWITFLIEHSIDHNHSNRRGEPADSRSA